MSRRIVQVSAYYPPHVGGQEWAVADLATNLASDDNDVRVITSAFDAAAGVRVEAGVEITRLRSVEFAHTAIIWNLFFTLLLRVRRGDVVHVHIGQAFVPEAVWLASKFKHFRYIAEMHIEPTASGPVGTVLKLYKRTLLKRALRGAAAIIVLNKEHQTTIKERYGYRGKVVVMNNGMSETFFEQKRTAQRSKVLRLLAVARFSPQKNLPALVEALRLAKSPARLDIVGDGEERPKVEAAIRKFGLQGQVTLHGALPRAQTSPFYAACDAFVLPSLYEAQPLVLLEAMAARAPIIGTNVRGIGEHIKGVGFVAKGTTPAAIAAAIDSFAQDPKAADANAAAAFQKAQAYRWPNLLQKYQALYDEVAR